MINLKTLPLLALAMLLGTAIADEAPTNWDGLIEVKPRKMDAVFLMPGADFRPYTKVMIDPTEVAFHKDWMKNMNEPSRELSRRISQDEAAEILAAARSNFDDIFKEAFTKAGYAVVTAPAPDVLRVSTAVVNLYLNAPDTMSPGRSRTFTANAGEATVVIEVRDSTTGALLGRVLDRRETMDSAGMQMATSVSNLSDFRQLFKQWATTSAKGIDELKAHSPVPLDLKPKQKL
jgi:hypothetical protein